MTMMPVCGECRKALSPEEYGYGHDCEPED